MVYGKGVNQSFVSVTFRESGHETSYLKRAVTVLVGFMLFRESVTQSMMSTVTLEKVPTQTARSVAV